MPHSKRKCFIQAIAVAPMSCVFVCAPPSGRVLSVVVVAAFCLIYSRSREFETCAGWALCVVVDRISGRFHQLYRGTSRHDENVLCLRSKEVLYPVGLSAGMDNPEKPLRKAAAAAVRKFININYAHNLLLFSLGACVACLCCDGQPCASIGPIALPAIVRCD